MSDIKCNNINGLPIGQIITCLDEQSNKIKNIAESQKKNNFLRYIYKHKGKIIIILGLIVIIVFCVIDSISITGDIPSEESYNKNAKIAESLGAQKTLAFFGYISSTLILALIISITGIESYFIREEKNQLREEEKKYGNMFTILMQKRSEISKNLIDQLKKIIDNIKSKSLNSTVYITNEYNKNGNGYNNISNDEKIKYLNMIEFAINHDKSLDEEYIASIIKDLDNILDENNIS